MRAVILMLLCLSLSSVFAQKDLRRHLPKKDDGQTKTVINKAHLSIALATTLLSIDNFDAAGDIGKLINEQEKLPDYPGRDDIIKDLKSDRGKRRFYGISFLIIGVTNLFFTFERVKIEPAPDQVKLTVSF